MIKASLIIKILSPFILFAFVSAVGEKNIFSRVKTVADNPQNNIPSINQSVDNHLNGLDPSEVESRRIPVENSPRPSVTYRHDTGFNQFNNNQPQTNVADKVIVDRIQKKVKHNDDKRNEGMEEEKPVPIPSQEKKDIETNIRKKKENLTKNSIHNLQLNLEERSSVDPIQANQMNRRVTRGQTAKLVKESAQEINNEIELEPNQSPDAIKKAQVTQSKEGVSVRKAKQVENQPNQKNQEFVDNLSQKVAKRNKISPSVTNKTIQRNNDDLVDFNNNLQKDKKQNRKEAKALGKRKQKEQKDNDINQKTIFISDEKMIAKSDENIFKSIPLDQTFETTSGYRSYQIIYDETFLIPSLKFFKKLEYYDRIKNLIKRIDVYIDNYLKSVLPDIRTIDVKENLSTCDNKDVGDYFNIEAKYFKQSYSVKGDILVFIYAVDDKSNKVLATAKVCGFHSASKETSIANLRLNISKVFPDNSSSIMADRVALDIVTHELLHILGFNTNFLKEFNLLISQTKDRFPNLAKLDTNKREIFDKEKAHWNTEIIPNDIMAPVYNPSQVLSIFSLEFIEMVNFDSRTRRDYLKNNSYLDRITDLDHFLQYTCDDEDEVSEYSHFCTQKEKDNNVFTCDDYFIYRLYCSNEKYINNCYEKESSYKQSCIYDSTPEKSDSIETFGDNSRCFMVNNSARCLAT